MTVGTTIYNEANSVGTTILTDMYGCDSIITVCLHFHSVSTDITVQNPDCIGETGFLTANTIGTSPFTYFWSNNATTQTTSTTSVGTYVVTVTDTYSCSATASAMMTVANPISLTTTTIDESACGESDGTATVTASGGTAPYAYLWSNGQTTATATALSAGTYTVTVTAADGCTLTSNASIFCGTSNTCESTLFLCDPSVTFSVGTNAGSAQAGPDYGCVGSQPNPIWYGFSIMSAGDISMLLNVTPCLDIDYVLYGPFETPNGNCNSLTADKIVDCSYAAGCNNEIFTITNGQVGEFYQLLITNFSNTQGNVDMMQTAGAGILGNPTSIHHITGNYCTGDGYELIVSNGDVYNETNPIGSSILPSTEGCDSVVNVNLSFSNPLARTAPFAETGTTIGAGNDCDPDMASDMYGNAEDVMYEIIIPSNGTWEFSLVGSDYDTYLFLGTSCCSMDIATDDNSGGNLTSYISTNLIAGTYYLTIDGTNGSTGNYNLLVSREACEAPSIFNVTTPTYDTALFDWNDVNDAIQYRFRIREVGSSNWIITDVTVSETINLFAHQSNTTYEWQVKTDCGYNNFSDWSALQTFTSPTAVCSILDSDDFNTIIDVSNGLEVTLEWPIMPLAEAYQLAGKKVGGNVKVFPETQLTSRTFTSGILYNTSYLWSVRVKCDGVWTDYALPPASFTTPQAPAKHQGDGFDIFATVEPLTTKVYPNPTNNEVTISVNTIAWENDIHIAILDMTGRILMQEKTTSSETTLNVSHLNEGYYFVRTENAGSISTTKLVVVK